MKKFTELTTEELLNIDTNTLTDSIKLEAISRGIKIPLPVSDKLKKANYAGYQLEKNSGTVVYTIVDQDGYRYEQPKLGYLDRNKAVAAMEGLVTISEIRNNKYQTIGFEVKHPDLSIKEVHTGVNSGGVRYATLEEITSEETEDYSNLVDECRAHYSTVVNEHRLTQRDFEIADEFLRLSQNNVKVAKDFWKLTYTRPWPYNEATTQV